MRGARGFTLIEVMVALGIFALIGIASYRVLSSVTVADERLKAHDEEMRSINRACWLMQQDLEQLAQRPVRAADGSEQPWLRVTQEDPPLQFTRSGRSNPLGLQRSDLQRVMYRVDRHPDYEREGSPYYHDERHYLLRYSWPYLDGSGDWSKALVQVILPDIDKLSVTVLTKNGPQLQWPPESAETTQTEVPLALQLRLTHSQWGEVVRTYKIF